MSEYLLENREIIEKMCIDKIACKNDAIIFAKLVLDGETLEQHLEKIEKDDQKYKRILKFYCLYDELQIKLGLMKVIDKLVEKGEKDNE